MGQQINLTESFNDPDNALPYLFADYRMCPGSLFLFDMTDLASAAVTGSGAPAAGDTLYNNAWENAAAIIGSGSQSSLAPKFLQNGLTAADVVAWERTSKGALHGMVSQTNQASAANYDVELPDALKDYILAHTGHDYGLWIWSLTTRAATSIANYAEVDISNSSAASANYLFVNGEQGVLNATKRAAYEAPSGFTGTPPGSHATFLGAMGWGNVGAFGSLDLNNTRSYAMYMAHLVDITHALAVNSQFTFAYLDALDAANFAAAFATGGRYHGDTMSDPSMALP